MAACLLIDGDLDRASSGRIWLWFSTAFPFVLISPIGWISQQCISDEPQPLPLISPLRMELTRFPARVEVRHDPIGSRR